MNEPVFKNIFRSNKISFNDEGIAVCPYCNGTGLNAEFELLNEYHEMIEFPLSAHCLKCYGKKRVDWIEFANGRFDDELEYLLQKIIQTQPNAFLQFLSFVYNGYKYQINDYQNYQYNTCEDQWIVSEFDDWPGHIDCKKEMLFWINKLICAGYIRDYENPEDFAKNSFPSVDIAGFYSHYYDPEYDWKCAAEIKLDILNATEFKIENLIRMRGELEILGFTIEDLNEICICDESGKTLEVDFVFTWKNLLDKFKLPYQHKYSRVPEGILTFD
jgi:hypothetical protein